MKTQVQLGRHELHLLEHSQLKIEAEGTVKVIDLADRDVERIAVTLQDYGLLQDRIMLDRFLRVVAGSTFTASFPEQQASLRELKELGAELLIQYNKIAALDESRREQPFFNCWFLSIPQVFVLLDGVDSAEAFWKRLQSIRHFTTGRLDFYADLATAESIERA